MKRPARAALLAAFIVVMSGASGGGGRVLAGEQTVTLRVGMGCATCPYIVQHSLEDVPGVAEVKVSYRDQSATVTFDDERTDVAALTAATAAVGFPATPLATN